MLGPIGIPELLIVLVIVLIIFGAGKLPQIGSALGQSIRNFKKSVSGQNDSTNQPAKKEDK